MIRSRSYLEQKFKTGDKPVQEDFWDWIDSFVHKTEVGDAGAGAGLSDILKPRPATNDIHTWLSNAAQGLFYMSIAGQTNAPDSGLWYYIGQKYNEQNMYITAYPLLNNTINPVSVYVKYCRSDTWTAWSHIGDGCNAEKLGGKTYSQVMSNMINYVNDIDLVRGVNLDVDPPNLENIPTLTGQHVGQLSSTTDNTIFDEAGLISIETYRGNNIQLLLTGNPESVMLRGVNNRWRKLMFEDELSESGTWTPNFGNAYGIQAESANWYRIGNLIFITLITYSDGNHYGLNNRLITGLPRAVKSGAYYALSIYTYWKKGGAYIDGYCSAIIFDGFDVSESHVVISGFYEMA